jgi:FKBP-type peptidyl-prolyl cis-trans isomerase
MNRTIFFLLILFPAIFLSCAGDSEDPDAEHNKEIKAIDDYIASLQLPPNSVLYDNTSGIRFIFNDYGEGPVPKSIQNITYSVNGAVLANGQIGAPFITTISDQKKLSEITPVGLGYAINNSLEGSSFTVFIPSRHAYGSTGQASLGVPPNATIKYDVALEEVERTVSEQTQFEADTAAIHDYLLANSIDAIENEKGISYSVNISAAGENPHPYSNVTIDYELSRLAAPSTQLEKSTLTTNVFGLIDGLKIGIPLMDEGSTYTFYIPSGLAYGPTSSGSIPANSNLIFKIKLTSID